MLVDWRRAEAEDDGLELRLGLSIGRSFDVSSGPAKAGDPARRREARKRQQQRRDDRTALEAQRLLGRARDRTAREIEGLSSPNSNPNVGPVVVPMYFPVANGVGFPCMMPVLAPPARHRSEINFPAGGRSFPPFPAKEEMGGAGLKRCFSLTSESAVSGCSSGISDFLSASLRVRPSRASSSCSSSASSGDNSKKRSHSSLNATTEQPQEPQLQLHLKSPSQPTKEEPDNASPTAAEKIEGKAEKQPVSLPRMPCVSTTGPDGKTINGFLYRYSKAEVSIVCVCHGSSFSPSEFVRHAGVTDVSHPLRQIVVVPSA